MALRAKRTEEGVVKGTNLQVASCKWQGTLVSGLGYGTKYVRVRVRARVSGLHTVAYDSLMRPWRPLTYLTCVVTGVFSCVFLLLGSTAWFSVCVCSRS